MTYALIDADSIYFRAAIGGDATQKTIRQYIDKVMLEIEGETFMAQPFVAIKGRGNFRHEIYSKYKANRPELDADVKKRLNYAYDYMKTKHKGVPADNMEADDLVAIWASEARAADIPYIVVGIDKDLLQIPGNHYNFVKRTHQFMDDSAADLCLHIQCLTGDNADNIPGIKGIGPKKAEKILDGVPMGQRWRQVQEAWALKDAGSPAISRTLLTMLTSWEQLDDIREQAKRQAPVSQRDVRQREEVQDSEVRSVSKRDT